MNRVVWKFAVPIGSISTVEIPPAARVLLAGRDPGTGGPAIWVELDPAAPTVERRFLVYRTGNAIDGDGGFPSDLHVGSIIDPPFVWHVYERRA